jgi:hypothetical protein
MYINTVVSFFSSVSVVRVEYQRYRYVFIEKIKEAETHEMVKMQIKIYPSS